MNDEPVVQNPTYMADIRHFFTDDDINHMRFMGLTLGTYEGVKKHAFLIHFHTSPPNADMPKDRPKWSPNRVQTFTNWVSNGYPLGAATPPTTRELLAATPASRVRRNVNDLGDDEKKALAKAFAGLMARDSDPDATDSYFALAGIHGLPQAYCEHHDNPFNPWHRVYLKNFEDQLRSIEGCEDVTLPYWDITTPLPDLLQQPPFATYELPRSPWGDLPAPHRPSYFPLKTSRNTPQVIAAGFAKRSVLVENAASLNESLWGVSSVNGFQLLSIQAHDGGHNSIGPTMADQNVASYDPVFWFYHCNIDRLFWQWQQNVGATTLNGFESTLAGDIGWLSPPFNAVAPWGTTIAESLDLDVSYEVPQEAIEEAALENKLGNVEAARSFTIKRSSPVSVRVKGIDRLAIPGSFDVLLLADGEEIARRGFFQPTRPRECETCVKNGTVNIDFRLDQEEILDRKLSVEIEPVSGFEEIGPRFPLASAGNPTINARLLLEDE
jgi:tyrosinase